MALPKGFWGIDIGQCGLKALRVEMMDGQVTATAFDYVEHPKILSQPDADPDQLTREALEKYKDYKAALADGYKIFLPNVPSKMKHFTNTAYAMENAFGFNPACSRNVIATDPSISWVTPYSCM